MWGIKGIVIEEKTIKENVQEFENVKAKEIAEENNLVEEISEKEEYDIFGEKYRDIEKTLQEIDILDEIEENDLVASDINEDIPYEKDDMPYEEESIFQNIENENYDDLNLKKEAKAEKAFKPKKAGIFIYGNHTGFCCSYSKDYIYKCIKRK